MKEFSMIEREHVELIMAAEIEQLNTITDLLCMVDYVRDSIELSINNIDNASIEDTKDYLKSNISRLDTCMELVHAQIWEIKKSLNKLINKD